MAHPGRCGARCFSAGLEAKITRCISDIYNSGSVRVFGSVLSTNFPTIAAAGATVRVEYAVVALGSPLVGAPSAIAVASLTVPVALASLDCVAYTYCKITITIPDDSKEKASKKTANTPFSTYTVT